MKPIKFLSILFCSIILTACQDVSDIGVVIRPSTDALAVISDSFHVETSTIPAGSIYSESDKLVLGNYIDEVYGSFKIDFLSEFRYLKDYEFEENSSSDSLYLVMYYKTFFGDSSAVQEMSVYQLDKQALNFSNNYYSDIQVEDFCSFNTLLGKTIYTAYDRTISETTRSESDYCNTVKVKMPDSMKDRLMTDKNILKSQDDFLEFFKGVYVKNTYGSQTVLQIDSVNLELSYRYIPDTSKPDSLIYKTIVFPANKETSEVIHMDQVKLPDLSEKPDSIEFLTTPNGAFIKVKLPLDRIYKRIVEDHPSNMININNATLVVESASMSDYTGRLEPPLILILIREADVEAFFTQSLYPAPNIPTVLSIYDAEDDTYIFDNFGDYLQTILESGPLSFAEVGDFVLIPISGATDIAGTSATIRHLFKPRGVRVRSGSNKKSPMRLTVTYSDL
ncbi:MAG: DUF4270 domain-containing protein [Bacteroidia bacterium]|nr:DUF4270 domain-containing protein [Bacteroidia bacterium]